MFGLGFSVTNISTAINRSVVGFFGLYDFIAAYKAETDIQNVDSDGDVCNLMPKGTVTATSAHSTPILAPDHEGVYREYAVDSPVWKGGRVEYPENNPSTEFKLWTDPTAPDGWIPLVSEETRYVEEGVDGGMRVVSDGTFMRCSLMSPLIVGDSYKLVYEYSNKTAGSLSIESAISLDMTAAVGVRVSTEFEAIASPLSIKRSGGITDCTLSYFSLQSLSEPVVQTYSTDESGAVLSTTPLLQANKATTNIFFPSVAPVSETITVPAVDHILWMEGAGSITSSYGTATEASPLVFTGTAAGVVFTCTDVDIAQIQSGNAKTNYIPTTTAAASIPALSYTFPAANIDPSDAEIQFTLDNDGVDGDVLDIGGLLTLSYLTDSLVLDDGVNSTSVLAATGERDIQIVLTATTMELLVDTVSSGVGAYTPPAAGLITASKSMWKLTNKAGA